MIWSLRSDGRRPTTLLDSAADSPALTSSRALAAPAPNWASSAARADGLTQTIGILRS
jgi:hypothetical protein